MNIIDVKELKFFGGTYDNFKVAKYGSFILKNGHRISNKETITVYQGEDDIVFVYISGFSWKHNFILEDINYNSINFNDGLNIIVSKHNSIVRNKTIDNVLG